MRTNNRSGAKMKTAYLDTSFIMNCIQNKIDIPLELKKLGYEPEIIQPVIGELKTLENRKKTKLTAKIALIATKNINRIEKTGKTDNALLETATKQDAIATMDAELKRKAKTKGITIITIRQKKYLIEE